MKIPSEIQKVSIISKGKVEIVKEKSPIVSDQMVVLRTIYSSISHGTEVAMLLKQTPSFNKEWYKDLNMYGPEGSGTKEYPVSPGYENISEVIYIGSKVHEVKIGDIIWVDAPHQDYNFVNLKETPYYLLEDITNLENYTSLVLLRVALAGVHDSGMILGDNIFIAGCGVVGLLTAEVAKLAGADSITISDTLAGRRKIALRQGFLAVDPTEKSFHENIKARGGFDVTFETSGTANGLNSCIKLAKKSGVVTVVSTIRGDLLGISLAEEFHKNGLKLVSSMSVNNVVHKKYPLWDLARLNSTALSLLKNSKIDTSKYITNRYPLKEAAKAYNDLMTNPNEVVKAIFVY